MQFEKIDFYLEKWLAEDFSDGDIIIFSRDTGLRCIKQSDQNLTSFFPPFLHQKFFSIPLREMIFFFFFH